MSINTYFKKQKAWITFISKSYIFIVFLDSIQLYVLNVSIFVCVATPFLSFQGFSTKSFIFNSISLFLLLYFFDFFSGFCPSVFLIAFQISIVESILSTIISSNWTFFRLILLDKATWHFFYIILLFFKILLPSSVLKKHNSFSVIACQAIQVAFYLLLYQKLYYAMNPIKYKYIKRNTF